MKLDATQFRYITKEEFRALSAIEMGMRNHELVPVPLIESIAKIRGGILYKVLQTLLRNKLIAHDGKKYDGYRMTYHGYDYLALRALAMRGTIVGVGRRLGVGKESDVHFCQGPNGEIYALKLHRLGRISFRAIKEKRDYLRHRAHASWMYMARLAAAKEFAYMKALKDEGFPVPTPIDQSRHAVVMTFVEGVPLYHLKELNRPNLVLERLMRLLVRLARAGIIHGDFNEFNLMISSDEKVTLIDFPQIVHLGHVNARETFDRDVRCICEFFLKRLNIEVETFPSFDEVIAEVEENGDGALARVSVEGLREEDDALLVAAHGEGQREVVDEGDADSTEDDTGDVDENGDEGSGGGEPDRVEGVSSAAEAAPATGDCAFQGLLPDGGRDELGDEDLVPNADVERNQHDQGEQQGEQAGEGEEEEETSSEGEESDGPGKVNVSTGGRRIRRRQTAKEARKNLQRQQKAKPARPNNQKARDLRRMKHDVKEHFM